MINLRKGKQNLDNLTPLLPEQFDFHPVSIYFRFILSAWDPHVLLFSITTRYCYLYVNVVFVGYLLCVTMLFDGLLKYFLFSNTRTPELFLRRVNYVVTTFKNQVPHFSNQHARTLGDIRIKPMF